MDDWEHHNLICQHSELNKASIIPWFCVYSIATKFENWKTVFNFVKSCHIVWKHTLYRHEQNVHRVCQVGPWVLSLVPNHNNLTQGRQQRGVFIQNGCQHSQSSLTDSICNQFILSAEQTECRHKELIQIYWARKKNWQWERKNSAAVQSFWRRESCSVITSWLC